MQTLHEILTARLKKEYPDFYKDHVPAFIYANLKERFDTRHYQQEAFGRFAYYWNEDNNKEKPAHFLYHMATGSGKTLVMAGLIIYLYAKGYRNFLFFVNSSTIIDKTKDNFLNPASSKYLFAETISPGDKPIRIREVDNFQADAKEDIHIIFSTIQGLHSRLNTPKENSITYDDFEDKKIVLVSDEAHHINADTKKGSGAASEEIVSWEGTVNKILHANKDNVLLEFTATADLAVPGVAQKYSNKLIYDYSLKQFRKDGYSKEVKVLQTGLPAFQRALQAVLISQYRKKLFEKHGKNIKPVILFKSRTIKESQYFFSQFITGIKKLSDTDLEQVRNVKHDTLKKIFQYFETTTITLENLATELKEDFSEEKLISVNSREESEQKQIAVNSLEDESNPYRAVFAVDKLNEGWDVLNLFDIVRLYDTKETGSGKTTMSEAQLIGRGARYCPFQILPTQSYSARKFDDDPENELRICEELYYHSPYDPHYIRELSAVLEDIGIQPAGSETHNNNKRTASNKSFFQNDAVAVLKKIQEKTFTVHLQTGQAVSGGLFLSSGTEEINKTEREQPLKIFGPLIIRKAMNKLPFYQFANLKKLFPQLGSVSEFISSPEYIGNIHLHIPRLPGHVISLSPEDKLAAGITVLQEIARYLSAGKTA